jgi:hypothetical protein
LLGVVFETVNDMGKTSAGITIYQAKTAITFCMGRA